MKKLYLLMALVMVVSSLSVIGSQIGGWNFDQDYTDQISTNDFTATGTVPIVSGIINNATSWDGDGELLSAGDVLDMGTNPQSASYWINRTIATSEAWHVPIVKYDGSEGWGCEIDDNGAGDQGKIRCFIKDSIRGRTNTPFTTTTFNNNGYHHIAVLYNRTGNLSIYVDTVLEASISISAYSSDTINSGGNLQIGGSSSSINEFNGDIDEVKLYDHVLNQSEITALYNEGNETPITDFFNRSTEKVIEFNQSGIYELNNPNYQVVLNDEVSFTEDSQFYATYTFNIIGIGASSTITCDIAENGVRQGNPVSRSVSVDDYGSIYLNSGILTADANPRNLSLECLRTGGGKVDLLNGKLLVHSLKDVDGYNITYEEKVFNNYIAGSTSYSEEVLFSDTFTTSDKLLSNFSKKIIVVDGYINYDYDFLTGNISVMLSIDGENSSEYPRYGVEDSTGVGGVGMIYEVPDAKVESTALDIEMYAKSSNSQGIYSGRLVYKELVLDPSEFNKVSLNGTTFNNSDWSNIKNFTVNNTNVSTGRIVVHANIPHQSVNGSARNEFRISLADQNGSVVYRDVSSSYQNGVAIVNEVFSKGQGLYTVSLEAKTTGIINVTGGEMTAYLSTNLAGSPNEYNVTVFDEWNGQQLLNFSVVDTRGNTVSTVNGIASIPLNGLGTDNLTISSSGYFNKTVLNHDVTTNLNTTLYQAEVLFNARRVTLNTTITGGNYTIDGNTYDSGTPFNLSQGVYNVTFNHEDFYSKTQEVTVNALDNTTLTVVDVYNTLLTINVTDIVTGVTLPNNTQVWFTNGSSTISFSNETGYFTAGVLNETGYSVILQTTGYATYYDNVSFTGSTYDYNISLYTNNSIWVYAKDILTGNTLTDYTVELYNVNSSTTLNDSGAGVVKFEDITSGIYTAKVTKTGYDVAYYTVTMTGGSHLNLDTYLNQNASTTIFTILDISTGGVVVNAQIDQYKTVNGSLVLVQSRLSDITGRASFTYLPSTEYAFIVSKSGYDTLEFNLEPLYSTYSIRITPSSNGGSIVDGWYYYINDTNFYDDQTNNFSISITSGFGSIEYFNLTVTTPNGSEYNNYCSTAQGCTYDFNVPLSGSVFGDTLNVSFVVKESGQGEKQRSYSYLINDAYGDNTLASWKDINDSNMGILEKIAFSTFMFILILGVVATASLMIGVDPLIPSGATLILLSTLLGTVGFLPVWSAWTIGLFGGMLVLLRGVTQ